MRTYNQGDIVTLINKKGKHLLPSEYRGKEVKILCKINAYKYRVEFSGGLTDTVWLVEIEKRSTPIYLGGE